MKNNTPSMIAMVVVCEAYIAALSKRFMPIDWPMDTSALIFENIAMEWSNQTNMPIAPTAATDSLPNLPTQARSIKL